MDIEDLDIEDIQALPKLPEDQYPSDKRFEFVIWTGLMMVKHIGGGRDEQLSKVEEFGLKAVIKFGVQVLRFFRNWWHSK